MTRGSKYSPNIFRDHIGFTLVELLICIFLLSLISVLLFGILDRTSHMWRLNESRTGTFREARAALAFMGREISALHHNTSDSKKTFYVNPPAGPEAGEVAARDSVQLDKSWAGRLFFLASLPRSAQSAHKGHFSICAVGYYLAFTPDRSAFSPNADQADESSSSMKLYRYFRHGDDTIGLLTPPGIPQLFIADPEYYSEILAENITRITFNAFKVTDSNISVWDRKTDESPPAFIDIQITALDKITAARLKDKSAWQNQGLQPVNVAGQTFSTRIHFSNGITSTIPPAPIP